MPLTANNNGFFGRHRWLVWAAGIAVAVLLLASFMSRDDAIPVRAATVERSTIRSVISTNGKVEPLQSFEAHAPVGTTIKKLLVKEGDRVKMGQLLAQLDDADARSQAARALAQVRASQAEVSAMERGGNREEVLTLEAQLVKSRNQRDTAQRNLEALKRLQQQGAASPGEVTQAEDQLAGAEADLKLVQQKQKERYSQPEIAHVEAQQVEAQSAYAAAEDNLRQLNIRAPFDGFITDRPVAAGEYVALSNKIATIVRIGAMKLQLQTPEQRAARGKVGMTVLARVAAYPDRDFTGRITAVNPSVDPNSRVFILEARFDNPKGELRPGMFANARVILPGGESAIFVPRTAVVRDKTTDSFQIFTIENNTARLRVVVPGEVEGDQIRVVNGLAGNETVAVTAQHELFDGAPVQVR